MDNSFAVKQMFYLFPVFAVSEKISIGLLIVLVRSVKDAYVP